MKILDWSLETFCSSCGVKLLVEEADIIQSPVPCNLGNGNISSYFVCPCCKGKNYLSHLLIPKN